MKPSPPFQDSDSRSRRVHRRAVHAVALAVIATALALLGACSLSPRREPLQPPEQVRATIARLLPATLADRQGWAADVQAAFSALRLEPSHRNLCSALAVIEQESTYTADPPVAGLPRIAREEIDRRAAALHIPRFVVDAAMKLASPDGRSYAERIATVRTERQLSELYEEFLDSVPLGRRLFGRANPVRTGGPMQVSIAYAESLARDHGYPYPVATSIRNEVFTRRGGLYFGIAHLLAYPADYERPLYRFADFNAGQHASRNAAFQHAVNRATGIELALDGDLVRHGNGADGREPGATELAVRALTPELGMSEREIRRSLERGAEADFGRSELYRRVFEIAERMEGKPLPRAMMPRIKLASPKITRALTTEWFATRVDRRYQRCLTRADG